MSSPVRSRSRSRSRAGFRMSEPLEPRRHLTANVNSVAADNRGEVIITFSENVTNVNRNTVRLFIAGPDGAIGTQDDLRKTDAVVRYDASKRRLTIRGNTGVNAVYRVRLEDDIRSAADNSKLDGEYNQGAASGNNVAGGDFNFAARRDRSQTPVVRMSTTLGTMRIRMRGDVAPITVSNYIDYVNTGRQDNTFVTRVDRDFVIQGGSLQIQNDGQDATDVVKAPQFDPIVDEAPGALSNAAGTMAMARGGANSATNQWFMNLRNNSGLDSQGFTVFGQVIGGTFSVAREIEKKQVAALVRGTSATPGGVLESVDISGTGLANVPLDALENVTGLARQTVSVFGSNEARFLVTGGFQPANDLIVIRRVAVEMRVGAAS